MSIFKNFPTEKIDLRKKDGEIIKNIDALVQKEKIFVDNAKILIEEGDIFERKLPNEAFEYYEVIDRGFRKGIHGIPDHYQISVEKLTNTRKKSIGGDTYNISNESGRININSIDNSYNYTLSSDDEKVFELLLQLAKETDNMNEIIQNISEMKTNIGKKSFAEKYNDFIQSIANHITIFAPFIPMITKFLTIG